MIISSLLGLSLSAVAQQGGKVHQPTKASEVQAPIPGAPLSKEYVQLSVRWLTYGAGLWSICIIVKLKNPNS